MPDSPIPPPTGPSVPSLKRLKIVGLVLLVVMVATDLSTKAWMQDLLGLEPDEPQGSRRIELIDGFLALEGTWNEGVTFGLAPGETVLILVFTIAATLALLVWFLGTRSRGRLLHAGLALILSGAAGNLYDRIQWHKVRDFILMYVRTGGDEHKWPNYNVADACIVVGVSLIIWDSLFGMGAQEAKAKDAQKRAAREAKAVDRRLDQARERAGDA